jgi:hypothetical protein
MSTVCQALYYELGMLSKDLVLAVREHTFYWERQGGGQEGRLRLTHQRKGGGNGGWHSEDCEILRILDVSPHTDDGES